MAFTGSPTASSTYTAQATEPIQSARTADRLCIFETATYTHAAGAGTGEVNLGILPAGKITIFPTLSYVNTSAFAANADLHLGYRSHTKADGSTVNEDNNAFADNLDAATGGLFQFSATLAPVQLDSVEGIKLFAMIDTGNIEDDDTIKCWVAYTQGWVA